MDEELRRYIASLYTTLRIAQETINTLSLSVQAMQKANQAVSGFQERYDRELVALMQSEQARAQAVVLAVIDAQIATLDPDQKQH
jgi:N-methylhydantoinase B/oxoprolinase/acetone carboxylase alpha subunit